MSKLVEKLSKASRSVTTPIGFHSTINGISSSSMLLIAAVSSDTTNIKSLAGGSIDAALILDPETTVTKAKKVIKLFGDIPVGLATDNLNAENIDKYSTIGLDFVAFNKKTPISSMRMSTTGKFFITDSTLNMDLIRALNSIDINGTIIDNSKVDSLTIEHLLICKRFHEILHKPLLMMVSSVIADYELHQLWETGISGIVFPSDWSPELLERLRHTVDNLPKKHAHITDKPEVILPQFANKDESLDEDEDEEEE
jgi:hypothetical protein